MIRRVEHRQWAWPKNQLYSTVVPWFRKNFRNTSSNRIPLMDRFCNHLYWTCMYVCLCVFMSRDMYPPLNAGSSGQHGAFPTPSSSELLYFGSNGFGLCLWKCARALWLSTESKTCGVFSGRFIWLSFFFFFFFMLSCFYLFLLSMHFRQYTSVFIRVTYGVNQFAGCDVRSLFLLCEPVRGW